MIPTILGLDIGGANLKASYLQEDQVICRSSPFPLWKNPEKLATALAELVSGLSVEQIALTMTGELCDCFHTKRDGVGSILSSVGQAFSQVPVHVWSTEGRFLSITEAQAHYLDVAASNWHGLATFAGRYVPSGNGLLIDIGTTTTDIIPLQNGVPVALGKTDPGRMQSQELVYTGVKRTPLCALLGEAGMAEFFATSHDAYLWMQDLPESPDDSNSADGRPCTRFFAQARLARMVGGDIEITPEAEITRIALQAIQQQESIIEKGIRTVLKRLDGPISAVVFSGAGEFLARRIVQKRLGFADESIKMISLNQQLGVAASEAACAYAMFVLARKLWL